MTPKDAEDALKVQQRITTTLKKEIEVMDAEYNALATTIEKAMAKGRMGEPQLLAVKDDAKAPAKSQQDSISLGVIARSLAKKRTIVERKERLIHTLSLFIQEDQGVLRKGYTTAYFQAIMAKRGGLTEKERADKVIFGAAEAPVIVVSDTGSSSSSSSSSAAAAAASASASGPVSYAGAKREEAPLTKTGEVDKRFKTGAK